MKKIMVVASALVAQAALGGAAVAGQEDFVWVKNWSAPQYVVVCPIHGEHDLANSESQKARGASSSGNLESPASES